MPTANAEAMSLHLEAISRKVASGAHAVLVFDGAGYHGAGTVIAPQNVTLLQLPPYAPELNPIENVWQYLRAQARHHRLRRRRYPRQDLRSLELLRKRSKPHRLNHKPLLGNSQSLGPLV